MYFVLFNPPYNTMNKVHLVPIFFKKRQWKLNAIKKLLKV